MKHTSFAMIDPYLCFVWTAAARYSATPLFLCESKTKQVAEHLAVAVPNQYVVGAFANDPTFEEATLKGESTRESLRPESDLSHPNTLQNLTFNVKRYTLLV